MLRLLKIKHIQKIFMPLRIITIWLSNIHGHAKINGVVDAESAITYPLHAKIDRILYNYKSCCIFVA